MIGLVLVTHGRLADEFRAALEHVMGPQKQIEAVTIGADDDSDLCRSDIIEAVNRVDSGDGVAILLHEKLDGVVLLGRGIGELAGIGLDQADLDRVLRLRGGADDERSREAQQCFECGPH